MAIGFYDHDIYLKPTKLLLNLEMMKIAAYYHNAGQSTNLLDRLDNTNEYDEVFVFRNLPAKNVVDPKNKVVPAVLASNVHNYGLAYSGGIYLPMEEKFETQTAYPHIYGQYLREKITSGQLNFSQVERILNAHFLRLRAGSYNLDLTKLKRKDKVFLYDYEIEKIEDWETKLAYLKTNLMGGIKTSRIEVVNGFKFTSFENVRKLTTIPGYASRDVHLFASHTYPEFKSEFDSIANWVSPRDGIKYYFGRDINPHSNLEVIRDLCLSINKYLYTKSILRACEFIVDDQCEVSPLNKLQKDFQYWTTVRVGDQTLKEYFIQRNKRTFDDYLKIIAQTSYRGQFNTLCGITKNNVKKVGWYYHEV